MAKLKEGPTTPVVYVCVDCEASGPVPGLYNLVSLAAVPVVERGGRHQLLEDELYLELRPVFDGFERAAMKVHGLSRKHLEDHGLDPREGMRILRKWALRLRPTANHHLVFVGHNAPFDWSFISYYFAWAKVRNPFGWKALDTKALAMGKLDIPWLATNKDVLAERLPDIGKEDLKLKHRADYDARYQARILVALLDLERKRGGR
jgi:DNA polymerase III epsilon subunit-like protein